MILHKRKRISCKVRKKTGRIRFNPEHFRKLKCLRSEIQSHGNQSKRNGLFRNKARRRSRFLLQMEKKSTAAENHPANTTCTAFSTKEGPESTP